VAVAADALVALYNPQLAVWAHAPAANEIERHTLQFFLSRIGFEPDSSFAHFTSGGQEANFTAVVAALTSRFPSIADGGLRELEGQPTLYYLSAEGHHSFQKIAHATGLGRRAVRSVPVDSSLRMDVGALREQLARDRRDRRAPFLVVATAGTTAAGVIDPLPQIAELCRSEGLWLHVDAAWGGTALLSRRLRGRLEGIERADSVTWDAHKWLSVPVGAGMFFTREPDALGRAFRVSAESYVPPAVAGCHDSYETTVQWSRRFIGLKVFMSLAALGAEGYEKLVEHQAAMGDLLRDELQRAGFRVVNETPLPVVCFTHEKIEAGAPAPAPSWTG
jgi:aromatic-L-amino-acid decarboxylase